MAEEADFDHFRSHAAYLQHYLLLLTGPDVGFELDDATLESLRWCLREPDFQQVLTLERPVVLDDFEDGLHSQAVDEMHLNVDDLDLERVLHCLRRRLLVRGRVEVLLGLVVPVSGRALLGRLLL